MSYLRRLQYLKAAAVKAQGAVAANQDQIQQAVERAGAAANERTGGKYKDRITKLQGAASTAVTKVSKTDQPGALGSAEPGSVKKSAATPTGSAPPSSPEPPAAPKPPAE